MKITDVTPIPTQPTEYSRRSGRTWTFVRVATDEEISGFGEATNYPGGGSLVVASTINQVREALIGEDPFDIDRLWHKIFRRYIYLGSRGLVTAVIAASTSRCGTSRARRWASRFAMFSAGGSGTRSRCTRTVGSRVARRRRITAEPRPKRLPRDIRRSNSTRSHMRWSRSTLDTCPARSQPRARSWA